MFYLSQKNAKSDSRPYQSRAKKRHEKPCQGKVAGSQPPSQVSHGSPEKQRVRKVHVTEDDGQAAHHGPALSERLATLGCFDTQYARC